MLRLVYHTNIFGPLHLEYEKPLIRAGSSKDNDLILLHPSVQPHHCFLSFEDNTITVRSCGDATSSSQQARYTAGDTLLIGDVPLVITHSPNSVSVSAPAKRSIGVGKTPEGYWKLGFAQAPADAHWICRRCKIRLHDDQLKVIGLKNRTKHRHCPLCGRNVELLVRKDAPKGFVAKLRAAFREKWPKIVKWLLAN